MAQDTKRAPSRGDSSSVSTTREAKEEVREAGRELKDAAEDKGQELKARAREKKDEAVDRVEEKAEEHRHVMADKVHAVAAALRSAGEDLEGRGEAQLASMGRQAAEQIERLAGYLDGNDVRGLLSNLEGMARDNPGTFLGTTFASGLAAGRFLRSSEPDAAGGRAGNYGTGYGTAGRGSDADSGSGYSAFSGEAEARTRTGGIATSAQRAGSAQPTSFGDTTDTRSQGRH